MQLTAFEILQMISGVVVILKVRAEVIRAICLVVMASGSEGSSDSSASDGSVVDDDSSGESDSECSDGDGDHADRDRLDVDEAWEFDEEACSRVEEEVREFEKEARAGLAT